MLPGLATPSQPEAWIHPDANGLHVQPGDFYLDPLRAVDRAVISHGHADHARPGNRKVWATPATLGIMRIRYGKASGEQLVSVEYGEPFAVGPVQVRLVPAGHVLGSAQIVLEYEGCRVVYSGDYKRKPDPTCLPFEVVPCDVFITEATFGLPVFRHPDPQEEVARLLGSMRLQPGRTHVVGVYSLGKAQRLIALVRQAGYRDPVYLHGALRKLCKFYQSQGMDLGELLSATVAEKEKLKGALVVAPPAAIREKWGQRLHDPVIGFASGWMTVRQRVKQRNAELPLKISDHADWEDLLRTIEETGCREVWVTHGQEDALVHECKKRGLRARPLALVGFDEGGGE